MFRSKTLFVVGAGGSFEAGLPTGATLKNQIARAVNIRFRHLSEKISGDDEITEALNRHVQQSSRQRGDINPYIRAGWKIHDAMPQAISIDNFIDAHRGDKHLELIGKLGIVHAILEAEKGSRLKLEREQKTKIDYAQLETTWYNRFT